MKLLLVSIVLYCLVGCSDKDRGTSGILDKEKMETVMWDFIKADVFTENFIKKDSLKNPAVENMQLQNKIFSHHNISKEDFYKSYDYYMAHNDVMKIILDSLSSRGERERSKMVHQRAGIQPK
ncbi:MAG: DUF4296 domain-containing protein [Ferruginibacter sp.]